MDVENEILNLYSEGKWSEILDGFSENSFLPWIWPKKSDLTFIGDCFNREKGEILISIGCGSGLLEWFISKSTGINVLGIELDKSWWTSKYAKLFIPVSFVDELDNFDGLFNMKNSILLFCYFNNKEAFIRYMQSFRGNCFMVIGPGPEKTTYTIPEPFSLPEAVDRSWKLKYQKKIGRSEDYVAVYTRT